MNNETYTFPNFYNLTAEEVIDGKTVAYNPGSTTTWAGRKYTAEDMIQSVLYALIRKDDTIKVSYLDPGIQSLANEYEDSKLEVNGKKIPSRILYGCEGDCYVLYLVTDQYTYYANYDSILMLSTEARTICSDNSFAEDGFYDSIENINNGNEKLLYGELPGSEV